MKNYHTDRVKQRAKDYRHKEKNTHKDRFDGKKTETYSKLLN